MVSWCVQMVGRKTRREAGKVLKFYHGEALDLVADAHFGLKRRGRGLFRESDVRLRKRCTEAWSRYCVAPPARTASGWGRVYDAAAVAITLGIALGIAIAACMLWGAK